ncbi:uncharacterized protein [Anser cygnoides]|uniref:uncharacterized protein isoform X2 n=1 Tax=Anser cygnoides TaxID=8845 RepID=UPI0034D264D0
MEPNHTAPSPAPPTPTPDGEDACEIDVPDMAVDGVTLLICLCGLVGNGAVLWLLGCRIRRNPITVYILNLAVADFTFLLFMLTSALLYILDNLSCSTFPVFMYLRSFLLPLLLTHNMGMYLLTAISIESTSNAVWPSSPCTPSTLLSSHHPWSSLAHFSSLRSSAAPSGASPGGSTSLSSSPSSSSSSSLFPSASGISCSMSVTCWGSPRWFSCLAASTAASTPSSTSWWGAAGGAAPWCPSRSPSGGSSWSWPITRCAVTMPRWTR